MGKALSIKSPWYGRVELDLKKINTQGKEISNSKKYKTMERRGIRWPELSKYIRFQRDKKCLKCGRTKYLQADHFHPLCYRWKSYFFRASKIQTLCKVCHGSLPSMKIRAKDWRKYVWL